MQNPENKAASLIKTVITKVKEDSCNYWLNETMEESLINSRAIQEPIESLISDVKNLPKDNMERWIDTHEEIFDAKDLSFDQKVDSLLEELMLPSLEMEIAKLNLNLSVNYYLTISILQATCSHFFAFAPSSSQIEENIITEWTKGFNLERLKSELVTKCNHPQFHKRLWDENLQTYLTDLDPKGEKRLQDMKKLGITKMIEADVLVCLRPNKIALKKDCIRFLFYQFCQEEFIKQLEPELEKMSDIFSKDRLDDLVEKTMPSDITQKRDAAYIEKCIREFLEISENRPSYSRP